MTQPKMISDGRIENLIEVCAWVSATVPTEINEVQAERFAKAVRLFKKEVKIDDIMMLVERLRSAEEALKFYADWKNSWIGTIVKNDSDSFDTYYGGDDFGGKRARAHFEAVKK